MGIIIPKLLQEGCILQQGDQTRIWGWCEEAGAKICIQIQENKVFAQSDQSGYIEAFVKLPQTGGPYTLTFSGENGDVLYVNKEVYVGDVYVCSGQSNVELPISRVREMFPEEKGCEYVHEYKVEEDPEFHEELTEHRNAYWRSCVGEDLEKVSALGYFFAKHMHEAKQIPIGFINISKGGTPIEAWMGKDSLVNDPDTMKLWKEFENDEYRAQFLINQQKTDAKWHENLVKQEKEGLVVEAGYHVDELVIPGDFTEQGLQGFSGLLYLTKTFFVEKDQAGKKAVLRMGTLIDSDRMFINGVWVGETGYCYPPRIYHIPEGVLREGENEILIRLEIWNGHGKVIGGKKHSITVEDGTIIDLEGSYKAEIRAVSENAPSAEFMIYKPTVMFQGMTAPCFPCTVKGVVWYQGESNGADADNYERLLTNFIDNWRMHWKQERLPFIIIQLPAWAMDGHETGEWAVIREAQQRVADKLADVGITITLDTGEWNDLHPLNKKEVGRRASLTARKLIDGEQVVAEGPSPVQIERTDRGCQIVFDTMDGSELSTVLDASCEEFEVAAEDQSFHKVQHVNVNGNKVSLEDPVFIGKKLCEIRYAYHDSPLNGLIKNDVGLITAPFRRKI